MISVIVPVYNVENYITKCLDSLLYQTYNDLQIIAVDDGSTDNSLKILKQYENRFDNFIILSQKNQGVSRARNLAFQYVKGEYTLYVDSDDFLEKDMIEIMYKKAKKYNSDIIICEYYIYYGKNNKKNYIQKYNVDSEKIYSSYDIINMMLEFTLQGQLWHKLFKTELLKQSDFKFAIGRYIQDIFPVFKIVSKSDNIVFIKRPLYYYRQLRSSTVHKKNMKIADDYYFAMTSIFGYIKDSNVKFNKSSFDKFRCMVLLNFIGYYVSADKNNNYAKFKDSKYYKLNIKITELIFISVSLKVKLKIFVWKLGAYNLLKNLLDKYKN